MSARVRFTWSRVPFTGTAMAAVTTARAVGSGFPGPRKAGVVFLLPVRLKIGNPKSDGASRLVDYHPPMSVAEIQQLPLREKLLIMETIWEELRERAESSPISPDQKNLLDARRSRVNSGEAKILEWDEVKHSVGGA